ncbi:innate immunity activator protein [Cimex lectularius]|uniref:Cytohesin Ubiquitin Protein Inducing domain-containing protein n=1 Tax=Cimex lectularius TaxID=79782 RepID=A0A8I6TCD9_CIMLE|nr:innate immunity activator protein [Cimex lectularius]
MVASLQNKKEALEAKLRDKTSELRKLCIEEAELTGVLPVETPIEPGEGPPHFRRRIGTAFTYPENLINKLNQKSKEDEAVAALELECKIQTGIAEAALGLANDVSASKSVRRKHRLLFEESQRRLSELEAKLSAVKQVQPKHKKKPRPHTDLVEENGEAEFDEDHNFHHPTSLTSLSDRCSNSLRHSHTYGGLPKQEPQLQSYPQRMAQSHMHLPTIDYRHNLLDHHPHQHHVRSNNHSPIDPNAVMWNKGRENWQYNHVAHHPQYMTHSPDLYAVDSMIYHFNDRFGSLDRNVSAPQTIDTESRVSSTLPRNVYIPHSNTLVLLPSQTYPENSLMRTQSLGNMDNLKQQPDRKTKEKEWYETSLDASPPKHSPVPESPLPPTPSPLPVLAVSSKPIEQTSPTSISCPPLIPEANQASVSSIHFETVVPYESPKNHTVVQAGKWQPYREVTKPFEMSDFYKYSTKFRQTKNSVQVANSQGNQEQHSSQQKVVYKPPQPLECQPVNPSEVSKTLQSINSQHVENYLPQVSQGWYHDKTISKPRSSTLV